ncbi:hypothetical protein EBT31_21135 [bacterium]|jgi:hypothetical protein|nr:hypothetical protein [bacterium]
MLKKQPKTNPEAKAPATYRELNGSSYIVLSDGTVARKLKPRLAGQTRYWFLSHDNHLRCISQKTIDEMTTFP